MLNISHDREKQIRRQRSEHVACGKRFCRPWLKYHELKKEIHTSWAIQSSEQASEIAWYVFLTNGASAKGK